MLRHRSLAIGLAWLAIGGAVFALAAPRTGAPGLYYDEAFMAQQAKDFFQPGRRSDHAGSIRTARLFGRPVPLRNAVYLGSLKSQLLIPSFALFGATPHVLRLTSLALGCLALLFAMLWAQRLLGTPAALWTGLLIASDPSWLFFSLYEWGPFTTGLLCRCAGFFLVSEGWCRRRRVPLLAGAWLLGLGVYNRADFAVILGATALALIIVRPATWREALGERSRDAALAAAALLIGAAPMLFSLGELLSTGASSALHSRGGFGEKLRVLWSVLDGSRYYRVISAGGLFDRMFDGRAPMGGFGVASVVCAAAALLHSARQLRARAALGAESFLLLAGVLVVAGMLAVPGAVRAHHLLNLMPFPHLLLAAVAVRSASRPLRLAAALALSALVLSNAAVVRETYELLDRTGGRGRFSLALHDLAREIEATPEATVVSLDWGFHEPLLFLTDAAQLEQPIWRIPQALRSRGSWVHEGGAEDLYLVHPQPYDLFGLGPRFLRAAKDVARRQADPVEIRLHRDLEGEIVFESVRFGRPHRITLRRGAFRVELQ